MKKEGEVFKVTVVSAVLNLVLNLVLIPKWQENAAAFTTLLAEGCTLLWSVICGKKMSGVSGELKTYIKVGAGCVGIVLVNEITKRMFTDNALYVVSTIALSVAVYAVIEIALKNEAVYSFLNGIKNKIGKSKG